MDSGIRFYSIGVVVQDKELDSWDVFVYPVEKLPTGLGGLKSSEKLTFNIKDINDKSIALELEKSFTIKASWMSFGQYNRASAPDIRRGETVLLIRFGGEDDFYWIPLFSEFNFRKKEQVMYFFSNKDGVPEQEEDLSNNGYYFTADTINKQFMLHTSNNDGEQATFDVVVDGGEGKIIMKDGAENQTVFDSVNASYSANFNKDITHTSGETMNFKTANEMNLNVDVQMNLNFKGIAISNGSDELITVLEELLDAILQEKHIGNLGAPTQLDPGSMSKYQMIKQKITKFKG